VVDLEGVGGAEQQKEGRAALHGSGWRVGSSRSRSRGFVFELSVSQQSRESVGARSVGTVRDA
jgi:hypothetical protein